MIFAISYYKVEAKRAVPRSEVNRETSSTVNKPSAPLASSKPPSSAASSTTIGASTNSNSNVAAGQPALNSHVDSYKPSSAEEANGYTKIFVGGLHYDTRDGKLIDPF